MAITRRQFIRRSTLAATGAVLGPSLFSSPFVRRAIAETIGDRYLVVLFLDGGNDGLNTVTPRSAPAGNVLRTAYEANRRASGGGIRLASGELLAIANDPNTGEELGLHPGFGGLGVGAGDGGLKALYDAGRVAVVQGCGYPDYSLSHEDSRLVWQTANPLGNGTLTGTGWVGRHLQGTYGALDVPAVCIDNSITPEFRQTGTSVLAISRVEDFGFPYDRDFVDSDPGSGDRYAEFLARRAAFEALSVQAGGGGLPLKTIGDSGRSTLLSSERYPEAHGLYLTDRGSWSTGYDDIDRSVAGDLREVAKIIYAQESGAIPEIGARFFQLSNGGYDTHSDQGGGQPNGQHYGLHAEVGASLKHFFDDLDAMGGGAANKVAVVVYSEFARRIRQNDNGTDHGSQGPMFVVGGAVNGGVFGNHPNIDDVDDEGNTRYAQSGAFRSTDFRDVYGTILKHWANMPGAAVAAALPTDPPLPGEERWTTANFDLAFLP